MIAQQIFRSSCPEEFFKKDVHRNFAKYRNGLRNTENAGNWRNFIFRGMLSNIPRGLSPNFLVPDLSSRIDFNLLWKTLLVIT